MCICKSKITTITAYIATAYVQPSASRNNKSPVCMPTGASGINFNILTL